MRVLIVTPRYLPHGGGLVEGTRGLVRQLRLAGNMIEIVADRYPRGLPAHELVEEIPVTRLHFLFPRMEHLQAGRLDLWLAGFVFFPLTLFQLAKIIRRFQPDVVNLHYLGSPGFFLWIMHHMMRFRFVVSMHGGDVDGEPYRNRFNRWLFGALLRRADRVTTCSRSLLEHALTLAPEIADKARPIHSGVDVEVFANAIPFAYPRPYLFAAGQLEKHKGFDVLLSAFAHVSALVPNVDLLIAGKGTEQERLAVQIRDLRLSERAQLLGPVSHDRVASFMRGALAVVIPSRREPFGLVGVEALAAGTQVIVARVGGLRESLEGADVIWADPGDVGSLAAGLTQVLRDRPSLRKTLKENQVKAAGHSWKVTCERYLVMFSEITQQ